MNNKSEVVKSLESVKLVLGNGFDLHCGLHTRYSDFYCKNYKKYRDIQKHYKEFEKSEIFAIDYNDKQIQQWNTWDIFFALNSSEDPFACSQKWCDIETMILSSLVKDSEYQSDYVPKYIAIYSSIKWEEIEKCVCSNRLGIGPKQRFVSLYMQGKIQHESYDLNDFYGFLVKELKLFEKSFGSFIYYQTHDRYLELCNQKTFYNERYYSLSDITFSLLCDYKKLVSVDTFNYTEIRNSEIKVNIRYVNGNSGNPIFGIDSIFEPGDKRFIFTKTCRRMDADLVNDYYVDDVEFHNLVIYGHSLNKADYSYFFPLFDKMKLVDSTSDTKIVFGYSVFDDNKADSIRKEVRESILKILHDYATYTQIPNPNRFLDSLTVQRRVVMYEIPVFEDECFHTSHIDDSWDKLYKEIETLGNNRHLNK